MFEILYSNYNFMLDPMRGCVLDFLKLTVHRSCCKNIEGKSFSTRGADDMMTFSPPSFSLLWQTILVYYSPCLKI